MGNQKPTSRQPVCCLNVCIVSCLVTYGLIALRSSCFARSAKSSVILRAMGVQLRLIQLVVITLAHGLPNCLKTAIITMIPMKESSSPIPSDYRPISLTICVGKFIERIVRNMLYRFLEEKNIIIKEQSGFRSKRGTSDNLVFITQKNQECINRGKKVCDVYFRYFESF